MTSKPRVVFLGSRVLGKFALEYLCQRADIDLIGKVVLGDYSSGYWKEDPSDLAWPPTLDYAALADIDFDLGISVNYWAVIKPPILNKPRLGFFNIHHSYNLMYRGGNINTFASLEARKQNRWYHGTTLHRMAPSVYTGDIVVCINSAITETDTAFSLFCKVEALCRDLIVEWFPRLWLENVKTTPPSADFKNFRRKDMIGRRIEPDWHPLQIYDHVRALTFPPFERPYVESGGVKQYLTISPHEGLDLFADAGRGRRVFYLNA